jgi:dolichyl-phosphate beta-glucosyltransferase
MSDTRQSDSPFAKLSVIIPAYNEADRLPAYLHEIRRYFETDRAGDYEAIVVDDGSLDHTVDCVEGLMDAWPELRLVRHAGNRGKGAAIRSGISAAEGDLILLTDADGATPIQEERRLRDAIQQGADLVAGSRRLESPGRKVSRIWWRDLRAGAFCRLVRLSTRLNIHDTQCGFKMVRASVARTLIPLCREEGYLLDVELLILAQHSGLAIAEIGVDWTDMPGSKVRFFRDPWSMALGLWRLQKQKRRELSGHILPSATENGLRESQVRRPHFATISKRLPSLAGRVAIATAVLAVMGLGLAVARERTRISRVAEHGEPLAIRPERLALIRVPLERDKWLPKVSGGNNNISITIHLVRAFGLKASVGPGEAPEPGIPTALDVIADQRICASYFGSPTLTRTAYGLRCPETVLRPLAEKRGGEAHRDQLLATLAEAGLPLSFPVRLADGQQASVRDILRDTIANFHLKQDELMWTATALSLYLPPRRSWLDKFGEETSFDQVADELMSRKYEGSPCAGTHLLYALTILARADREMPLLSAERRQRLRSYLAQARDVALGAQEADGNWRIGWHTGDPASRTLPESNEEFGHLIATSHLAEWLLYLPKDIPISSDPLYRAGRWLLNYLETHPATVNANDFCPRIHAICVLQQIASPQESAPLVGSVSR